MKGALFMALGALGLSFLGLFVLFGIHEVISPGPVYPEHNRKEGGGVLCVVLVPFSLCALLFRRGLTHWRNARDFDRLFSFAAKQDRAQLTDAATALSLAPARVQKLLADGVARGFISDPQNAALIIVGGAAPVPLDVPGNTPLFATLAGHAYAVLCFMLLALEKQVGRGVILFTCCSGILLTFVLHTVGVVGGFKARRTGKRAVVALVLSIVGYLGVGLLVIGTSLELVFGPR
jgi:hypothetical protein